MSYKTINQQFVEKTDRIKISKKLSYKGISVSIGLPYSKMKSIRRGDSSADAVLLEKLDNLFPELFKEEKLEDANKSTTYSELSQLKSHITSQEKKIATLEGTVELLITSHNAMRAALRTIINKIDMSKDKVKESDKKEDNKSLSDLRNDVKDLLITLRDVQIEKGLND